jgi:Beta-galactosidase/beta-glucuronidase
MKVQSTLLIIFLTILFSFLCIGSSWAQNNEKTLWSGLEKPQPKEELPFSNAPYEEPIRKAKRNLDTQLIPVKKYEWILSEGWELAPDSVVLLANKSIFDIAYNTKEWYDATVPGTVLTTLVEQGVYPDPYFGLNNMYIPDDLCRTDWWYRITFNPPRYELGKKLFLQFNGINYRAEVYLNGDSLGRIDGAFARAEFDITDLIKRGGGKNILAVKVIRPDHPGIPHEQSIEAGQGYNGGALSLDGPTFISSVGWDWMPGIRDRNMGIWQDVRLKVIKDVRILDTQVITNVLLPDTTKAEITIKTYLKNENSRPVEGILQATIGDIIVKKDYVLSPNEIQEIILSPEEYKALKIKNPKLWWPNGYGKQNLYTLQLETLTGNAVSDLQSTRFGIRELSYELMVYDQQMGETRVLYSPTEMIKYGQPVFDFINRKEYAKNIELPTLQPGVSITDFSLLDQNDPVGPFLVIRVNGVRIFCRGGNWGMDDAMKRSSRERLEPYMQLHKQMNFNIIRNWTGESTEEVFYELCDEYGMLVWNDFWITTDDTVEPIDQELFLQNATDVVKRFRNHPSIALWCPRNEGYAPKGLDRSLTNMLAKEDPTRHYHGQSRYLNIGPSGPWGYFKDPSLYYTNYAKGFNTEMGTFAIPTASTISKFLAPEDLWPINDVWAYHDLHHTTQRFQHFMEDVNRYGEPQSMETFSRRAQFVTYDAWRSMIEAWNSKMWDSTTGLILWMSHPAWPSMIWQTYSYDYDTPASYFASKKACEPIHIQKNLPDHDVIVLNTTREKQKDLQASISVYDMYGNLLESETKKIVAEANSVTPANMTLNTDNKPDLYLVRLELKDKKGNLISVNDYWEKQTDEAYKELARLSYEDLQVTTIKRRNLQTVRLTNHGSKIAPALKLNAFTREDEIILPAFFSDGYFNLLPGETRFINFKLNAPTDNCDYILPVSSADN